MLVIWRKLFGHLKVFNKMLLIGVVSISSLIIVSGILLLDVKEVMINEKKSKLKNIVQVSYSIVQDEYMKFQKGIIDEKTAKQNALKAISILRFDGNNYIWINDDSKPYPKMIMHPVSQSLNGKTLNSKSFNKATQLEANNKEKDLDNLNIFQAFVEVTSKSDSGYVSYLWAKPNEKGEFEKLSYVKKFSQWGWILGSGIYIDDVQEQFNATAIKILFVIIIILFILIFIFTMITKEIVAKVIFINKGLENFFNFLNRKTNDVETKEIVCKDEFGDMSRLINENILKAKEGIKEDRELIDETISVLTEFEQGDLCQRLKMNVSNPALMQLKDVLNNMASHLEENINSVLDVLEKYTHFNYLDKVNTQSVKKDLLRLANGVNELGDSITSMLAENKSNGLTLQNSSKVLLSNVNVLNTNANEAASSLEETAAALEQITGNIRNNTENIAQMANLATNLTKSSTTGENLANSTVNAMEDIDSQVSAINESISIIDQIAFQTNILSLNAAVEAATAGESGKGFAVVAQEVRNLASRSAEAAKEIKELVENATHKANEGKHIATNMIEGYKTLNNDISQTTNIIQDVEMSSKEQLSGIEQINDAVALLDQQTQKNAEVASQTNDVALSTDKIANVVVQNVDDKQFRGQNEVKAKNFDENNTKYSSNQKINKEEITQSNSNGNDEWESF